MKKLEIRNTNFTHLLEKVNETLVHNYTLLLSERFGKLTISGFNGKLLISYMCDTLHVTRGVNILINYDAVLDLIEVSKNQTITTLLISNDTVIINNKSYDVGKNTLTPRPALFADTVVEKRQLTQLLGKSNSLVELKTMRSELIINMGGERYQTGLILRVLDQIDSHRIAICVHDTLLFIRDDLNRSTSFTIEPE